jgi:eukaryotic-like serine/threonine-protein kinase
MTLPRTSGDSGLIENRYELMERVGEGAMGIVFAARDLVLDIPVAVKMLRPAYAGVPEVVRMFEQEASLSARMLSPHVVKVIARATSAAGTPCIVYEYLEGESVAARLERSPQMSLEEVCAIVLQTARALSRAHALGVVHRDIKPDNLFLVAQPDARPLLKVLDFGVAEKLTRPGGSASAGLLGTTAYLAPEVLFGPSLPDARTDLYALGVVAYECLTGACPYPPDCYDDLFGHMSSGTRRSVRQSRPELPEEIDEWMDRALHPDPFWRFASARELATEMERVLRAGSVVRPRLRPAPSHTRVAKRPAPARAA